MIRFAKVFTSRSLKRSKDSIFLRHYHLYLQRPSESRPSLKILSNNFSKSNPKHPSHFKYFASQNGTVIRTPKNAEELATAAVSGTLLPKAGEERVPSSSLGVGLTAFLLNNDPFLGGEVPSERVWLPKEVGSLPGV